jgi:hypothetical protein
MRFGARLAGLGAMGLLIAAAPVCKIPVFRYALERWPASPYVALVFHKGPLDEAASKALDEARRSPANLAVEKVDVDRPMDPNVRKIWEAGKSEPLPWAALLHPGVEDAATWTGRVEAESFRTLLDSPARKEMLRRILTGDSAVWLLIESGEKEKDEAAAAMLAAELPRLEKTLEIPTLGKDDPPLRSKIAYKLAFSTLRLSRADAAEKIFVEILLRGYKGPTGPVVVPVVGRARAVWALAGDALKPESVADLAEFVTGSCSCEVKELNPGFDLLMAADWEALLELGGPEEPPPLEIPAPVLPPPRPREPEPVPAPVQERQETGLGRVWLWAGLLGALAMVILTGLNVRNAFRGTRGT